MEIKELVVYEKEYPERKAVFQSFRRICCRS